ncbi:hypothetical protein GCM10009730_31780 [Streptomyces albidochromogenes]|uniref:hypothetical protein n=1 Tax=Streptomyces albidochromogenes TaxID=329524 RepID=UPI00110FC6B8|nr:hypothetical protein [Streptomyces albidochromogenes]
MARNLWIGKPGLLREISQAAKSWDRSADLNITEFRSLEGRVTLVAPPRTTRRMKLSFEWLEPDDAQHLVRLARRVTGPGMLGRDAPARGSVVVLDPASVNLLDPLQAAGQSLDPRGGDHWFTVAGDLTFRPSAGEVFTGDCKDVASAVGWTHGAWTGWPVAPGMDVSWRIPPEWDEAVCTAQLDWKAVDGSYLSTTAVPGPVVSGTAPAAAAFVTPVGRPGRTGAVTLAGACLTIGEAPAAHALGDGCPPMAVTNLTDTPSARLPYRNIAIDLVEVRGAAN